MVGADSWIDGRYRVEQLLGRGGMADVVRAHDSTTGRAVAVKLLRLHDDRSLARFRNEIEVLAQLDHPGIVRLLDSGCHGIQPYLVLDLVEGPTLATLLVEGALGEERTMGVGEQLAAALAYAHDLDITHRDVKPSNVLFDDAAQRPRLADFGLAQLADTTRITQTGACVGTAAYLAPEQLEGDSGPPADVFSLGLVVIECLTGALCYPGMPAEAALARLHRTPIVPADLPRWLQHILRTMTRREPDRRPTAHAVAEAFHERSADPLPSPSSTSTVITSAALPDGHDRAKTPMRVGLAAAAMSAVLIAGSLLSALTSRDLETADPPQDRPVAEAATSTTTTAVVQAAAPATPSTTSAPTTGPRAEPPRNPGGTDHGNHTGPRRPNAANGPKEAKPPEKDS